MNSKLVLIYIVTFVCSAVSFMLYYNSELKFSKLETSLINLEKCSHHLAKLGNSLPQKCNAIEETQKSLKNEKLTKLNELILHFNELKKEQGINENHLEELNLRVESVIHQLDSITHNVETRKNILGKTFVILLLNLIILTTYFFCYFLYNSHRKQKYKKSGQSDLMIITEERYPDLIPLLNLKTKLIDSKIIRSELFLELFSGTLSIIDKSREISNCLSMVEYQIIENETELLFKVRLIFLNPLENETLQRITEEENYLLIRELSNVNNGNMTLTGDDFNKSLNFEIFLPWLHKNTEDDEELLQAS